MSSAAGSAEPPANGQPCAGLTVAELAVGASDLGLGLAGGLPGRILADLGATVIRVVGRQSPPIDADVPWGRAWHRDKKVAATDDSDEAFAVAREADVVLAYGPEELVEARGLGYRDVGAVNPAVVYARCRPSRAGWGTAPDFGLLVEARSGFCTQLAGHRAGPIFVDVRAPGMGTAALLTTSVLGLLYRRAVTGRGGWAETSLYDGMLATLGCMIGRSERAAPHIEGYWEKGSTFPNFLYRCADGELLQVWFGGKGMYAKLIAVLGDEPSSEGYYSDQTTGKLGERARRWGSFFSTRTRAEWIRLLRQAGVACEPVLGPGEILADPHLAETGLALRAADGSHDDVVVGSPISVLPIQASSRTGAADTVPPAAPPRPGGPAESGAPARPLVPAAARRSSPGDRGGGRAEQALVRDNGGLLSGLRVVDFSAFVAGPLAAEVLADLGADVIKVEPPAGEAMRAAAYAVAACQRGKRSLALDISAPEARPAVERLLSQADVVLHNFRVGVAERLGIDAATVARLNPRAVYCHASAFGSTGRRAKFPGNDALMEAVTGTERAIGGAGNDPIAATWIPIDITGGWLAAAGMLAGLYARGSGDDGQRVETSLLGAGILLHSGVFLRDGALVPGPVLDGGQTGYGPGYRIYRGSDDAWFALVVPTPEDWRRLAVTLRDAPPPETGAPVPAASASLPETYAPLRGGAADTEAVEAETVLEAAFAQAPAAAWAARLQAAGLLAELVRPLDRDAFRRGILDDQVNRQLNRVVTFPTDEWGKFEQIGPLLRCGPAAGTGPRLMLPGIGEHTEEVLRELGLSAAAIAALLEAKLAVQLGGLPGRSPGPLIRPARLACPGRLLSQLPRRGVA
jgi:crotonobetainyl-CoA:carnitine CoA-transferase CaiB-like acyl-CoA transferase